MASKPANFKYGFVAKIFHWTIFVLIGVMFPMGYVMIELPLTPQKLQVYSWHKSIGITILTLAVLRLVWRQFRPAPPLPSSMPEYERFAAHAVHVLLYVCLFALPVSGWLMSSAAGLPVVLYGQWQLPDFVAANEDTRLLLFEVHKTIGFSLLALLAAHVGASLYHHFVRRDDVLARMWPFRLRSGELL